MTCTFCTDEVREKVPSFPKATLFSEINHNTEPCFCLFEAVTGYRDLRKTNLRSYVSIEPGAFATQQHKTNTFSRLIIKIQI